MDFDMSSLLGEDLLRKARKASGGAPENTDHEDEEGEVEAFMKMTSRTKAWKLCHDYLQGAWKTISHKEIKLRQSRYATI